MPKYIYKTFALFLAFFMLCNIAGPSYTAAALPKFLGGSGYGVGGQKANIEGQYPTFWDKLMKQQSYVSMYQGVREMAMYKYKDAANSFAKAVIKNPDDPFPHVFLGMALYWQGQVDAAMAEYRLALELDPKNDEAHQLLGIAHAWKGEINEALKCFEKAIEINPNRADAQMNIGSTYSALGKMDETLFHFRKAVSLDKKHPLYQYQLASIYERLGRDSLAEESFKKAISLFPYYEEAYLALAVLYEKINKNTNAEINYKKALKIKPGDSVARLRLANLLAKQNRKTEALEILNRGFLISPLSNEGLGLSLHYSGGASASSPAGGADAQKEGEDASQIEGNKQLDQFKNRLEKVPSSRQITIEVELSLTPKLEHSKIELAPAGDSVAIKQPSALAQAIEAADDAQAIRTFSRSFILVSANDEDRKEQLDSIFEGFKNVLTAAGDKYDVQMALRAGTPVTDTSVLGGQSSGTGPTSSLGANTKAGYNPYMVGNDMGLWTPNKNWVNYIREVMPDILQRLTANNPADYMVAGLAYMALGQGNDALEAFTKAQELFTKDNPKDLSKMLQLTGLGKGTAYIVLGDEARALKEYKEVTKINPSNEIANTNIAVLSEEK